MGDGTKNQFNHYCSNLLGHPSLNLKLQHRDAQIANILGKDEILQMESSNRVITIVGRYDDGGDGQLKKNVTLNLFLVVEMSFNPLEHRL